jgi:hypothetical protein
MDREAILKRIENIREELSRDQYQIIKDKIYERTFYLHGSNRNSFSKKVIETMRRKLAQEIELILKPILDNQQEINLRFLEEIERLKKAVAASSTEGSRPKDENEVENPIRTDKE